MKKNIILCLLFFFLTACEKKESFFNLEVKEHISNSSSEDTASISQVSISNSGSNNIVINGNEGTIHQSTTGNNSPIVNGNSVVITQSTSNNNNSIIYINGKAQVGNNTNKIDIKLTGEKIKIPLLNKTSYEIKGFIPVEQHCTKENFYLEIDSSFEPFINKDKLKEGVITLLNHNYNYHGNVNLVLKLVTPPLTYLKTNGTSSTKITCVTTNDFTWIERGNGKNTLLGTSLKKLTIDTGGMGDFNLEDISVNEAFIEKSSMGNFTFKGHINNLNFMNNGMGNTSIDNVKTMTLNHSGMGNITIFGKPQILQFNNTGMGKVNIY